MLIDLNLRKVVCAVAASTFFSLQFSAFGDTVYWLGNSTGDGLNFSSTSGWSSGTYPTDSDDVVIDENYIKTTGNGYLVDGYWSSDTTWNSLTLNYDTVSKKLILKCRRPNKYYYLKRCRENRRRHCPICYGSRQYGF